MVTDNIPQIGSRWVHTNGNKYVVIIVTNIHSERQIEYPTTVVYIGDNGRIWSRPLTDWRRSMSPETNAKEYPPEVMLLIERLVNGQRGSNKVVANLCTQLLNGWDKDRRND
jgi:hypothetical protein